MNIASANSQDKVLADLSSGATVTVQAMFYSNETFGYYGVFSPSRTLDFVEETLTLEMVAAFPKVSQYYVSVGIFDIFVRRNVNVQINEELIKAGANVVFEWKNGAHDWGVWRSQFSEFVKDYLWDRETVVSTPSNPDADVAPQSNSTAAVKTGDSVDMTGLLIISGLSLLGISIQYYYRHRKTH